MTNTRVVLASAMLAAAALAAMPSSVEGQTRCAEGVKTVGSTGISLLDCDCVIGSPFSSAEWSFRSEPRIMGIERNSPAAAQLRVGDVIKSVGDVPITTAAGAKLLAVLKPGQPLSVVVERDGETLRRVLTADEVCADNPYLLGVLSPQAARVQAERSAVAQGRAVAPTIRAEETRAAAIQSRGAIAPTVRAEETRAATVQARADATRAEQERAVVATGGRGTPRGALMPTMRADAERLTTAGAQGTPSAESARRAQEVIAAREGWRATTVPSGSAWIGLGFSCSDCSIVQEQSGARWTFKTPPTVYSVEVGSPAYGGAGTAGMRRGDVLTHIDGLDITSVAGGRRLGSVKPNQTVKLRYRRPMQGTASVTRELTIVAGPSRAPNAAAVNTLGRAVAALTVRDTVVSHTLRSYEASRRQEAEQQQMLTSAVERLRSGGESAEQQAQIMIRDYIASTNQLQRQQDMIVQELIASQRGGEALEASRRSLSELAVTGSRITQGDQRLRYSGVFGSNDVEVRGLSSVVVTESGDELIITTSDATIRLKKPVPLRR